MTSGGITTTTDFVYEGLTLLRSTSVTGGQTTTVEYLTDAAGRPWGAYVTVPAHAGPVFVWIVTDARGDVLELLTADGDPLSYWRYSPYGEHATSEARAAGGVGASAATHIRDAVKLRFAGYSFDAESGLYYLSARYYDPVTAQFLTKDPAKDNGEESAYQYCAGDPVNLVDPDGKAAVAVALKVAGGGALGAIEGYGWYAGSAAWRSQPFKRGFTSRFKKNWDWRAANSDARFGAVAGAAAGPGAGKAGKLAAKGIRRTKAGNRVLAMAARVTQSRAFKKSVYNRMTPKGDMTSGREFLGRVKVMKHTAHSKGPHKYPHVQIEIRRPFSSSYNRGGAWKARVRTQR